MAHEQKLEIRQSQSLVMTTQLQQSIKLLQLSSMELNAFVAEELEKNPLLAREDSDRLEATGTEQTPEDRDAERSAQSDERGDNDDTQTSRSDALDDQGTSGWQEDSEYRSQSVGRKDVATRASGGGGGDSSDYIEQTVSSEISLRDHLFEQLQVDIEDPLKRMIGAQLIDMIDESGYLRDDMDSLAETLNAEEALIEETIQELQQFDPAGIFARSLQECLSLQLKDKNLYDPIMQTFVENIELMGRGELQKLQKLCGVDGEEFADLLRDIRRMNPKPASQFINDAAQAIEPDVLVRRGKGGKWLIELNSDTLPRVLLNQHYFAELDAKARDKEAKKYLNEQFSNASWLVRALDQRANTILKVATELVKQQEKFLLYGIRFLKPLTLKDIALAVDMHESTISRVTTNKFMSTPRGIFELKYFFTSSLAGASGGAEYSSKTVMFYIKEYIDKEDPKKILSDDAIVEKLKERNIEVARRTVAKYREAMHIPSSVVRRREKAHLVS